MDLNLDHFCRNPKNVLCSSVFFSEIDIVKPASFCFLTRKLASYYNCRILFHVFWE